jgi:hypothetical protein
LSPVGGRLLSRSDEAADLLRRNVARGKAAENLLGAGAKHAYILKSGAKIFPDAVDENLGVMVEIKNVSKLSYTSQIRNYSQYAKENQMQLVLVVRHDTQFSTPLDTAIADNHIQVLRLQGLP